MLPLQLVDSFLLEYHIGQALLLVFVVATVGVLPLKSQKLLALNAIVFGLLFALTPQSLVPISYLFLGLALLVVGPLLYATASR
ncbi:hypothetical protein [Halobellus sp. GM3]|uniref:hypothetical protein n=1 Tax=Halobellus sp. GM3 TaxID=3458410 RepID=UPI00403DD86F